jgi:hypothetical protein
MVVVETKDRVVIGVVGAGVGVVIGGIVTDGDVVVGVVGTKAVGA